MDDEFIPCALCGCLIGDEVEYGDEWCGGSGVICEICAQPIEPESEQEPSDERA